MSGWLNKLVHPDHRILLSSENTEVGTTQVPIGWWWINKIGISMPYNGILFGDKNEWSVMNIWQHGWSLKTLSSVNENSYKSASFHLRDMSGLATYKDWAWVWVCVCVCVWGGVGMRMRELSFFPGYWRCFKIDCGDKCITVTTLKAIELYALSE